MIKYLLDNHYKITIYKKGEVIYHAHAIPRAVYFIKSGRVRMVTVNEEGKEFIQGIFKSGEYFGEPALILGKRYLADTIATQDTEIIALNKTQFFSLLETQKEFSMELIRRMSHRLFYKSMMLEELANEQADHRISTLLNYLLSELQSGEELKLTRQQLADMSGLRVETVIRAIKKLSGRQQFKLVKGKLLKQ